MNEFKVSSWAGGTTTELYIYPEDGSYALRDFIYRISTASIDQEESNFTPLAGFSRQLAVVSKEIEITIDGETTRLAPGEVIAFDGDQKVTSLGKTRDMNLMIRKGFSGKMEVLEGPQELAPGDFMVLVEFVEDRPRVFEKASQDSFRLAPGQRVYAFSLPGVGQDQDLALTCASCGLHGCYSGDLTKVPVNCPSLASGGQSQARGRYSREDLALATTAAQVEAEGYGKLTRLEEIMLFCRKLDYEKLGLAFCIGLKKEARILTDILRHNGFQVESVICKNGSVPKAFIHIDEDQQIRPGFEAMCNPIAQAEFLNQAKTDFNIVLGLCVGHDSLFFRHSQAPVTVFSAKDRVLAHNPMGAIYQADAYMKGRFYKWSGLGLGRRDTDCHGFATVPRGLCNNFSVSMSYYDS